MIRASITIVSVVFCLVSACATGGIGGAPEDGGIKAKDGGIIIAKDSGGSDASKPPPKDSGPPPPVDSGGGCVKSPPSNVCGVYPQCGCGAQQTCEVDQTALDGTSSCIGAGTGAVGSACTQTAGQCGPGLTCIWGECHEYCGADGSKCSDPNTNYCVNLTDNNQAPIPNLLICHNDCQLQDPNSCGGGAEGCIYFDVDTVDCYPVGPTANCNATSSFCPPGQLCLTDQTNYFCLPWCRVNQNDCTGGTTCNSLGSGAPTVNGVEYGYCQ